jgi:hypothetical protein
MRLQYWELILGRSLFGRAFSFAASFGGPGGRAKSKLLYEIVAETTNVITKLSASPDPGLSTGFSGSTIVGAGCSCHQTRRYQHLANVHEDSVGALAPHAAYHQLKEVVNDPRGHPLPLNSHRDRHNFSGQFSLLRPVSPFHLSP